MALEIHQHHGRMSPHLRNNLITLHGEEPRDRALAQQGSHTSRNGCVRFLTRMSGHSCDVRRPLFLFPQVVFFVRVGDG